MTDSNGSFQRKYPNAFMRTWQGCAHQDCLPLCVPAVGGHCERLKLAFEAWSAPNWQRLTTMWSAEQAEYARIGDFELTAFVIAADPARGWDRDIGWELHGGPKRQDLITKGEAASFEDAKTQAEAAWREAASTSGNMKMEARRS